jgi:hypothetical protein
VKESDGKPTFTLTRSGQIQSSKQHKLRKHVARMS